MNVRVEYVNKVAQTLKDRLSADATADSHSVQTKETVKVNNIMYNIRGV